jgi:glycosyltransferase involved in cell wall biosynthesis
MKIKVIYVIETLNSGGVEQRRLILAKYLDKEKYEIKVICTFASGPLADAIRAENVEIIAIGKFRHPFDFNQYKKVIKIVRNFKPHIIHGGVFEGVTMAAVSGFITKVPIVIIEETSDPTNRSKRATYLFKFLSLLADKVVAISPAVLDYLKNKAFVEKSKVHLINNGVSIPRDVNETEISHLKSLLKINENDFVVGSVGRINNSIKLFTDIIEAISLLDNKSIFKILIIGKGTDEDLLKKKAAELGLADQLIMAGYQYDTAPFYKLMDVFCAVSSTEGFGLVAAEAMLHKLPLIATTVGGLKHVVINEETGFLIPPRRPDIIAEKIKLLVEDTQLRHLFGDNGYKRAINEYTSNVYVEKVDKMYNELCVKKGLV